MISEETIGIKHNQILLIFDGKIKIHFFNAKKKKEKEKY